MIGRFFWVSVAIANAVMATVGAVGGGSRFWPLNVGAAVMAAAFVVFSDDRED